MRTLFRNGFVHTLSPQGVGHFGPKPAWDRF